MSSDKVVDLFLGKRVPVLKLVQRGKFLYVETVGSDDVCTRELLVNNRTISKGQQCTALHV